MCQSVMQSQSRNDCWQLMGWLAALNMGFVLWRNNEPKRVWAVYDSHSIRKITKCRSQMTGSPCCGGSNSATTPFLCLLPYPEGGGGGRSHASPKPGRRWETTYDCSSQDGLSCHIRGLIAAHSQTLPIWPVWRRASHRGAFLLQYIVCHVFLLTVWKINLLS